MNSNDLSALVSGTYSTMLADLYLEHEELFSEALVEIGLIPRMINLGALHTIKDIEEIWNKIGSFKDGILVNAFTTASSRLHLQVVGHDYISGEESNNETWQQLIIGIAGALGHLREITPPDAYPVNQPNYKDCAASKDFLERGYNTKKWVEILSKNQWFIFILLIRIYSIDFIAEWQRTAEENQKKQSRKSKRNTGEATS